VLTFWRSGGWLNPRESLSAANRFGGSFGKESFLFRIALKKQKKGVPAQNEVLPFVDTNYCLETYEYDNEIVIIHNVKGRLKQNINLWKEKLLLADSSRNLVLPILEYEIIF
jgi:hypothetical protein